MEYKKAINTCVDKFRKQNLDIQHAITNPLKCDYRYVPMKSHVESWSVTAKKPHDLLQSWQSYLSDRHHDHKVYPSVPGYLPKKKKQ